MDRMFEVRLVVRDRIELNDDAEVIVFVDVRAPDVDGSSAHVTLHHRNRWQHRVARRTHGGDVSVISEIDEHNMLQRRRHVARRTVGARRTCTTQTGTKHE